MAEVTLLPEADNTLPVPLFCDNCGHGEHHGVCTVTVEDDEPCGCLEYRPETADD